MTENKSRMNINAKSFITAIIMLFVLMTAVYILTFIVPAGSYERVIEEGNEVIVAGTYQETDGGISFFKWILSPFLTLGAEGNITIIAIILFLFVIGGVFNALDHSKILQYMLDKICFKFSEKRYMLLAMVTLFFMTLGALVGSFEESVPMVPIAIALACSLGWDAMVGLGMSVLAIGCGFATGICNPFTVGVAQELAGVPMFSGISMRLLAFIVIYPILLSFLLAYARKIEKNPAKSVMYGQSFKGQAVQKNGQFRRNVQSERALNAFTIILGAGVCLIFMSSFISFLQDIIMPLVALIFLAAGTASVLLSGVSLRIYGKYFGRGVMSILPAVLLILMASSIKYTMVTAGIMDTILYGAIGMIEKMPVWGAVIFIYIVVLAMNFFIASGSAKAFLLIPLIVPMAELAGISKQVSILAFAFGDGFSNLFYPTNPVLLISLGLAGVSYGQWAKWSLKIQAAIFVATNLLLLLAFNIGY